MRILFVILTAVISVGIFGSAKAADSNKKQFNEYVLKAVALLAEHRRYGGYSIREALTQDLQMNGNCCVRAIPHPKAPWSEDRTSQRQLPDHRTMCVAAVHEIIVEALNLYATETHDMSPFEKRPLSFWDGSTKRAIKPYLYMYAGVDSNGTASALERFGMGREVPFSSMDPGDFINFNRPHSGHAAIFLGYLDKQGGLLTKYGPTVAGFKYFSAQGAGKPDAGFGYRWAYFAPYCPEQRDPNKPRDCELVRSSDQKYLNTGTMYAPSEWPSFQDAMEALDEKSIEQLQRKFEGRKPTVQELMRALSNELETELPFSPRNRFDGITTD